MTIERRYVVFLKGETVFDICDRMTKWHQGRGGMKIRALVIFVGEALAACNSPTYEPVIDLKASKNPGEAQMDWMGCEWLLKKYGLEDEATTRCLEGRGHSVIGTVKR